MLGNKIKIFLLLVILVIIGTTSIKFLFKEDPSDIVEITASDSLNILSSQQAEEIIRVRADIAIRSLKFQNLKLLDKLVHPKKGVRFSPYLYILSSDLVFSREELADAYHNEVIFKWGIYSDKENIAMTLKDYLRNFVYNQDFLNANKITYNHLSGHSKMVDNIMIFYPGAIIVEYHTGTLNTSKKEWKNLRLVFEEYKEKWYLVGVINLQSKTTY